MKRNLLLAVVLLIVLFGKARAAAVLTGTAYAGSCEHHSLPDAVCTSVFHDPVTGSEIRTESVFHAEYGYLYARTTSQVLNWNLPYPPLGGGSWASFEDFVTVTGSERIGVIEPTWDYGYTGFSEYPFLSYGNDGSGGPLYLTASIHVGEDPYGIFLNGEAWVRLVKIRVYDIDGIQLTSGLYYTSDSGTAYDVEGASQIPEPGTAGLALVALAFVLAPVCRRRLLPGREGNGSRSA